MMPLNDASYNLLGPYFSLCSKTRETKRVESRDYTMGWLTRPSIKSLLPCQDDKFLLLCKGFLLYCTYLLGNLFHKISKINQEYIIDINNILNKTMV